MCLVCVWMHAYEKASNYSCMHACVCVCVCMCARVCVCVREAVQNTVGEIPILKLRPHLHHILGTFELLDSLLKQVTAVRDPATQLLIVQATDLVLAVFPLLQLERHTELQCTEFVFHWAQACQRAPAFKGVC